MTEVSANEIAEALAQLRDEAVKYPTDEQVAVIEAAPHAPALVVAGAGSGKTETMANRVLWLVANGHVAPSQILGLTFTRKAAGELAERIRLRLDELRMAGLAGEAADLFDAPEISTYNSFASTLYSDNALVLGRDADGVVLGEAAAWQLARQVVVRSAHPRLVSLDERLDAVVEATLRIARGIADNDADPERVRAIGHGFAGMRELPSSNPRYEYAKALEHIGDLAELELLVDLAAEYEQAKRARGAVDYSDQVVLALRAVRKRPAARDELRARFPVVLLDEYQDTSVVQTRLLAELFGGSAVMAVGDPNQSIYGWRGASATNLGQFAVAFGGGDAMTRFDLTTSWRNGAEILEAANTIVDAGLASRFAPRIAVERLQARRDAPPSRVDAVVEPDVDAEARAVADWFVRGFDEVRAESGKDATAALLLRTRRTQDRFLRALHDAGLKVHVLGVGGLLAEPEIADLVSLLRVVDDPGSGAELLRLLAGARWRIGVADLDALRGVSSWLADHDTAERAVLPKELREAIRASVAEQEGGSIVDALDFVGRAREGHPALSRLSPEGLERLRDAAALVERVRSRSGLDLPDLVTLAAQELRLDIEVAANDHRTAGESNLDALLDALHGYLAIAEVAGLGGFLSWLREAELREDLTPRPEKAEAGCVQVLTVHGAKGLEWDLVAVPRWVEDELPAKPLEGYGGWIGFGRFPWVERGDAADLPRFSGGSSTDRKAFLDEVDRFKEDVAELYRAEERRLAYVAVTRARSRLLLSASFWSGQKEARRPSRFLVELADAGVIEELPGEVPSAPDGASSVEPARWPHEPFGRREAVVRAAAVAVRSATPVLVGPWAREAELLLEERERRRTREGVVPLPVRIPASAFKDYVSDPEGVAEELRRPMPERPYRATRLGTLFHSWVEERYGTTGGGSDELDAAPFELDSDGDVIDAERLAELQATFEGSEWAQLKPVEVEREIHLPFDGRVVICKIDAVYQRDDRFEVVDWKTGKAPKDDADLERKQLQLALYRLAYANWTGIDPELIDAAFYFVADDAVVRPAHVDSEEQLLARWRAAFPSA